MMQQTTDQYDAGAARTTLPREGRAACNVKETAGDNKDARTSNDVFFPSFLFFDDDDEEGSQYLERKDNDGETDYDDGVLYRVDDDDDDDVNAFKSGHKNQRNNGGGSHQNKDLRDFMRRTGQEPFPPSSGTTSNNAVIRLEDLMIAQDLQSRTKLIVSHMGTQAQCRGVNGDTLREAGAIHALLAVLHGLITGIWKGSTDNNNDDGGDNNDEHQCNSNDAEDNEERREGSKIEATKEERIPLPLLPLVSNHQSDTNDNKLKGTVIGEMEEAAIDLATAAMGAIRDLACGSAATRLAILHFQPPSPRQNQNQQNKDCCANGMQVLASYVQRYHCMRWEEITTLPEFSSQIICGNQLGTMATSVATGDETDGGCIYNMMTKRGKKELRLLTNAAGAIRNVSHSTPDNCVALHQCGVTELLIWRLLHGGDSCAKEDRIGSTKGDGTTNAENFTTGNDSRMAGDAQMMGSANAPQSSISTHNEPPSLPDPTKPWREASYRISGSLINLSEKCNDVAKRCGSDMILVRLLVEAWGGATVLGFGGSGTTTSSKKKKDKVNKNTPPLHLGLAAVLHAVDTMHGLDETLHSILDKEEVRRRWAQRKEEERKKRMSGVQDYHK